jgi:hypothetical protein
MRSVFMNSNSNEREGLRNCQIIYGYKMKMPIKNIFALFIYKELLPDKQ